MAKKRKTTGVTTAVSNFDVTESKKRIQDYRDVADSDDEFHDARDRIELEDGPEAKRRRKWEDEDAFLEESEEEVLGYSDEDSEEEVSAVRAQRTSGKNKQTTTSDDEGSTKNEDDEDLGGWGTTRADLYGADAIESEEQALEEEVEALRLQKKQLQSMSAADYGFDETEWQSAEQEKDDNQGDTVTEILPQLVIPEDLSSVERLKILRSRYPEFEPLSVELLQLQKVQARLQIEDRTNRPVLATKYRAATAYLAALTTYFVLLTSTAFNNVEAGVVAMAPIKLRDHAIMDSLVQLRALWQQVEGLDDDKVSVSDDDLADSGMEEAFDSAVDARVTAKTTPKMSRAERHAALLQAQADAQRQSRIKLAEADLADLDDLIANAGRPHKTARRPTVLGDDTDLGDEAPLTAHEAAEKAKKKKSLRFYTSQIAQKANKRGASGRNAGGDEDIPYRERHKDRIARLNAEAQNRGRRDDGEDLGGQSDEDDAEQARKIRAQDDGSEYYDMIAARTAKKKSEKAERALAQKQAELVGGRVIEEETVGEDGKRKITYAIEKNKGLTPFRKKDVRNPRVKKRKKYDEKKKKLASMKPVFKGGEGRGGYGGEQSGINSRLVKSTKL